MDEELSYRLGAGALDTFEEKLAADPDLFEDEEILIMRAMQSGEYLEMDVTEEDLNALVEAYHRFQADKALFEMFMRGDVFFAGVADREAHDFYWSLSPQGESRLPEDIRGSELPSL